MRNSVDMATVKTTSHRKTENIATKKVPHIFQLSGEMKQTIGELEGLLHPIALACLLGIIWARVWSIPLFIESRSRICHRLTNLWMIRLSYHVKKD